MGKPESVTYIGPSGSGQVTKLCNQICIGGALAGVAEAYALAKANGLEPSRVRQALLGGFAASKVLEFHGNRMLTGDYKPGFFVRLFQKDLRLAVEANMAAGVTMPVTSVVTQFVNALCRGWRRRTRLCGRGRSLVCVERRKACEGYVSAGVQRKGHKAGVPYALCRS